jgi:cytochrome P450
MTKLTLDIIGLSAFGCDFQALGNHQSSMLDAYNTVFASTSLSVVNALFPWFTHVPTPHNRKLHAARALIRNKVVEMIELKRREAMATATATEENEWGGGEDSSTTTSTSSSTSSSGDDGGNNGKGKGGGAAAATDLLGVMLNQKGHDSEGNSISTKELSSQELVDQVMTFLVSSDGWRFWWVKSEKAIKVITFLVYDTESEKKHVLLAVLLARVVGCWLLAVIVIID